MAKTPVWQRKAGQNPEGGLNEAGRKSLKAQGHDIKRPQPEGGPRKNSFCARMKGMRDKNTSSETANDPDSRINKSLRKWNCHADGGAVDVARSYRADGGRARYSTGGEPTARDYRQEIADIYQNFLGRDADQGGHDYWTEVLQSGKSSANQVRDAMAGSNEGRLNEIFKAELGRNADLEGRNFWLSANNGSPDWAQIRDQIAGSQEARNRASNVLSDASKGRLFNDPESALAALMWSEGDELRGWGQSHDQADLARRNLAGIGWTARNRAAADFRENMSKSYQSQYDPRNIVNQIYAPSAYSHFAGNREGMAASAFAKNPELENYYRAIAKDILSNNLEDPTQGAVSYYNPNRAATPDFAGAKGQKLGWYETGDLGSRAAGSPQYHVFYGQNDYTPKAVSFYGGDPLNIVDPNYPTYSADNVPYPAPRPPEYGVDFAGVVAGDYPTSSDGYAPTTHAPVTHAPVTHAPTTHAPVTHAPVTHAPTTHAGSGSVSFGPDVSSNYGVTHGISPTVHHTSASDPYFGHGWSGSDYSYGQSMFGHNMHFNPQTGQWMDQAQALHTDPSFDRQRGGRAVDIAQSYRKAGGPVWDRPRPKSLGKPEKLSPDEKASAKAAAKAAGRPYPNLVDNMRAAREDGGRLSPFMEAKIREIGDAELGKYGIGPNAPSSTKDELKAGPEQSTWESIAEKAMGDRPSPERRRFVEGMGTAADVAHMGSYLTPAGPYVAATDFAHGLASGNPTEAFLSASGLQGRAAKALGMATSALMPDSAQAGPYSKFLRELAEKYRPHYDPSARTMGQPRDKWLSDVKLSRPIEEMRVTSQEHRPMVAERFTRPEDYAGKAMITGLGDRTPAGYEVTSINDRILHMPTDMRGGRNFGLDVSSLGPDKAVWGSAMSRAQAIANKAKAAADKDYEPIFAYVAQGPQSGDFSHHMQDLILGQMNPSRMDPKLVGAIDKRMREAQTASGETFAPKPEWVGVQSPDAAARMKARADERVKLIKLMDAAAYRDAPGFADVGASRFASTDPGLLHDPAFSAGKSFMSIDPTGRVVTDPAHPHPSYDTFIPAAPGTGHGYLGRLEYELPPELHFKHYLENEIKPKLRGKPLNKQTMSLLRQHPTVMATPEWVDTASEWQDLMRGMYGSRKP